MDLISLPTEPASLHVAPLSAETSIEPVSVPTYAQPSPVAPEERHVTLEPIFGRSTFHPSPSRKARVTLPFARAIRVSKGLSRQTPKLCRLSCVIEIRTRGSSAAP